MSVEQYQKSVNGLDKEIADLEKKKAAKDSEVATLKGKINSAQKSITKNTSQTILNSKMRQISGYESGYSSEVKRKCGIWQGNR